jgi:NitT/TauT family transport system ATP-binding protein
MNQSTTWDRDMLEVTKLSKSYGEGRMAVLAIDEVTFTVAPREFVCIVGPSGCGKTTLLKCLSGLMSPTMGAAVLEGQAIVGPPKQLAVVFQEYTRSLLP